MATSGGERGVGDDDDVVVGDRRCSLSVVVVVVVGLNFRRSLPDVANSAIDQMRGLEAGTWLSFTASAPFLSAAVCCASKAWELEDEEGGGNLSPSTVSRFC
jgi:hypothetical protein